MARILIAEDSSTDVKFMESILAGKGHQLVLAVDGEEAEEKINNEKFDLVILDIVMPKKNGYQLCRWIKKEERFRHMPVVIVTSKKDESDRLWGKQQGADFYLTKPYEPAELLMAINKFIER
jgi:DNA-binding response OmpR family regulator